MKVSLITVTYNSSHTIKDTIDSVNSQSYENIEHIFIDGSSLDNTVDVINKHSSREKIIISMANSSFNIKNSNYQILEHCKTYYSIEKMAMGFVEALGKID